MSHLLIWTAYISLALAQVVAVVWGLKHKKSIKIRSIWTLEFDQVGINLGEVKWQKQL